MGESTTQPKPWLCRHCNELVDPTMSLCWNCGHDKEGVPQPAMFVDVAPRDITVCTYCRYDLHGNLEAERCPECGELVPWEDCAACGVRTSRAAMVDGCPACRAVEAGLAFIPEVELKKHTHCPQCRYELRGLPGGTDCPECGYVVSHGVYDTLMEPRNGGPGFSWPTIRTLLLMLLLFLSFPTALIVFFLSIVWMSEGLVWAGILLIVLWVISMMGCIILAHMAPDTNSTRDDADRRSH